ncbi:MAG: hypothetical protein ABI599_01515 [Flavobacteriales bacterium]
MRILFGCPMYALVATSAAQTIGNYVPVPWDYRCFDVVDRGAGNTLLAFAHDFWPDSSTVELLWTDAAQTVTNAVAFTPPANGIYAQDVALLPDGFIVAGGFDAPPFLTKLNDAGVQQWSQRILTAPAVLQGQYGMIAMPRGNDLSAYAYATDFTTNAILRFDVNGTGSGLTGVTSSMAQNYVLRIDGAVPTGDPDVHLLHGGSAFNTTITGEVNAVLGEFGTGGCNWMKFYDMQPFTGVLQFEEMWGMRRLSDGNYACAGYVTEDPEGYWHGFVMKVEPDGDVLWARNYFDTTGRFAVRDVVELPSGDFLITGDNQTDPPEVITTIVVRLSPLGDVLSAQKFDLGTGAGQLFWSSTSDGDGTVRLAGFGRIAMLDANGVGCDFTPVFSITTSPFQPTVTVVPVSNTPFTPTIDCTPAEVRPMELSLSAECISATIGIAEQAGSDALTAHPVPTNDMLCIGAPGAVGSSEPIVVRNAAGALVFSGAYGKGVRMGAFASGVYAIELPRLRQCIMAVRE